MVLYDGDYIWLLYFSQFTLIGIVIVGTFVQLKFN